VRSEAAAATVSPVIAAHISSELRGSIHIRTLRAYPGQPYQ